MLYRQYLIIVVPHLQWPACSDIVWSSSKSTKLKLVGLFCSKLELVGLCCSKLKLENLFLDTIEV